MNKQEAIDLLKDMQRRLYFKIKSKEDVAIETAISVLCQQLTNGWIAISAETNPKKSDIYLATFEENGNRYVERFYFSLINGWMMPVHWQDEGRIDAMLYWMEMPEPYKEPPHES